jgi:hypothetical protein
VRLVDCEVDNRCTWRGPKVRVIDVAYHALSKFSRITAPAASYTGLVIFLLQLGGAKYIGVFEKPVSLKMQGHELTACDMIPVGGSTLKAKSSRIC